MSLMHRTLVCRILGKPPCRVELSWAHSCCSRANPCRYLWLGKFSSRAIASFSKAKPSLLLTAFP